jgi:hypothetical protein
VVDGLDHLEPNLGPEEVASRSGITVADVDCHLIVPRFLANDGRVNAPEGLQVLVDAVEEILDDDCVLGAGKLEPLVEAGRRVAAAALAIGLGSLFHGVGLLRGELGKRHLGVVHQLVNGVVAAGGRLERG